MNTVLPTLETLTLIDIARIGRFIDNLDEKFRGTSYEGTEEQEAYHAAARIIRGEPGMFDEQLVRKHYEQLARESAFTKKGKLSSWYKINVYNG